MGERKSKDVWEEYRKATADGTYNDGDEAEYYYDEDYKKKKKEPSSKNKNGTIRVCPKCGDEYSIKTKYCPVCCERLPDPIDARDAEVLSYDIKTTRGDIEDGYSSKDIKRKLRAGGVLSIIAMLASLSITGLYFLSVMKYYNITELTGTNKLLVVLFFIMNGILLVNALLCFWKKTPDIIMHALRAVRNSDTPEGSYGTSRRLRRRRIINRVHSRSRTQRASSAATIGLMAMFGPMLRESSGDGMSESAVIGMTCGMSIFLPIASLVITAFNLSYFLHNFLHIV